MSTFNKIRDQFLTVIISTMGIVGQGHAQGLSSVGWKGCVKKLIEKKIKASDYSDLKLTDINNNPEDKFYYKRYSFNAVDIQNNKFNGFIDANVWNVEKVITEDLRTGTRTWDRQVKCSAYTNRTTQENEYLTTWQYFSDVDGEEPYFQIRNVNNTPLYSEMREVNYIEADHDDG